MSRLGSALFVFGLAGCMYLPQMGPSHRAIERYATASLTSSPRQVIEDYVLVDLSDAVLREVPSIGPGSFYRSFGKWRAKTPSFPVGVGDLLQITIYESSSGGLFTPSDGSLRPGNFITLPTQTVSRNGTVSVPYAGDVPVAGRTVQEVQKEIVRRLAGRAVEPQVVVTLGEQVASSVTVIGETSNKLQLRGYERVLDVIARAGGAASSGGGGSVGFPSHELFVTLVRNGQQATVYFPQLVRDPKENILVAPGDIVYLFRQQQRFVAFGNLGVSGQTGASQGVSGFFPFDQERISLSDAIAKAGGLVDDRANAQVFVFRWELREALERMGIDVRRFAGRDVVPTVYRANFRDPSVFFYTQRFPMRNKDAIYVANADAIELEKFLGHTLLVSSAVAGTTASAVVTRDAVRNLAHGAAQ